MPYLSGKVSVGGSNVVGVEGNGGAVSVLDEGSVPGAGRPNNGKEQLKLVNTYYSEGIEIRNYVPY